MPSRDFCRYRRPHLISITALIRTLRKPAMCAGDQSSPIGGDAVRRTRIIWSNTSRRCGRRSSTCRQATSAGLLPIALKTYARRLLGRDQGYPTSTSKELLSSQNTALHLGARKLKLVLRCLRLKRCPSTGSPPRVAESHSAARMNSTIPTRGPAWLVCIVLKFE